jgi:hypothetical protein
LQKKQRTKNWKRKISEKSLKIFQAKKGTWKTHFYVRRRIKKKEKFNMKKYSKYSPFLSISTASKHKSSLKFHLNEIECKVK